jgi:predicted methyltransferase
MHRWLILGAIFMTVGGAAQADDHANASHRLAAVLDAQPEEVKARYVYRHPQETLEFFGIEPGMTVVEALPGGGWYSKILMAYLGPEGKLIGADYAAEMFPLFGFFSPQQLKAKETWVADWPEEANGWGVENRAQISAFQLGSLPDEMKESADAVLLIRALHNLARFEPNGGFLSAAIQDVVDVLKPGGVVGVVQHQARDEKPDEWADGSRGYLKDDFVIQRLTEAGLEFAGMTDINFNDRDQPGESDVVWRLPPTLATSRDNPELRAELETVGESNRMTVKFRKPE